MSKRSDLLVQRIEQGAEALVSLPEGLTDAQWHIVVPSEQRTVSLYADAPLTAQHFIKGHALRHSFHHSVNIRTALSL